MTKLANKKQPAPATSSRTKTPQLPKPTGSFIDRIIMSWNGFERFAWDIVGVALVALAAILILGVYNLTHGTLLTTPVDIIRKGFGWGSFLVAIFVGSLGILAIRRRSEGQRLFPLGRFILLEIWGFILLANLAAWGGASLDRAQAGLDGGIIGWGLLSLVEKVVPYPWSYALLALLLVIFTLWAFGIAEWFFRYFEKWLLTPDRPVDLSKEEQSFIQPVQATVGESQAAQLSDVHTPGAELQQGGGVRRDARLPPLNILSQDRPDSPDEEQIQETARLLEKTLAEFGIPVQVIGYRVGPTVTQFAVEPGFTEKEGPDGEVSRQKVRVSQISALQRDLALALAAERLRIEAPVPGHSYVGIEVPNPRISVVRLRSLLESDAFQRMTSGLAVVLGRDVSGQPVVADLARMPHLLVAGTTGSGKSVFIEALSVCLAMNNTPDDLQMAMLDPKMVELVRFNGLPHLLGKVETEIDRMLGVLRWALAEMDHRYRLLEEVHVRDLDGYNRRMERRKQATLPRIVIMIDELADLMMTAPDQTEQYIVRLAQMARAVGIHLVVATQRPSTEVVTGLIKANFPARLSFTVASSIDSRVILDTGGAESLLGKGDLLFLNPEQGTPIRAQGVFVNDQEIERLINFWRRMAPKETGAVTPPWEELLLDDENDSDMLIEEAVKIIRRSQRASASLLQRRLRIGYPRAARLIDELESMGAVGPAQGGGKEREVLLPPGDDDQEVDEANPDV
ncbi:MAG TPA: DNA translocase FtsK [Anaerolineaceae bacterium]|nr:DNA translocase FtsK [Anaerolineaceae bacterium]